MERPLSAGVFHSEITKLSRQFRFARFALKVVSGAQKRKFFKQEYAQEISHWESFSNAPAESKESFKKAGLDVEEVAESLLRTAKQVSKRELGPKNQRTYEERIEDGLNQSELLLLVAYFETFLKAVHRQLLSADPKAVFGKRSDNQKGIQMKEIFENGFEDFLRGLIEKEVKRLDREDFKVRHEYFRDSFGIPFGEKKTVQRLGELSEVRNNISHHILDAGKIRIPNDADIKEARHLFSSVATSIWSAACAKYPKSFR